MSERVVVERVGEAEKVAHVQLNRPEKHNGLDLDMFEVLVEAGASLQSDRSVRAVVLSGRGKSFCAGLDWQSMMSTPDAAETLLTRSDTSPANLAQRTAWIWREIDVPVIAAIHGVAYGGGLQIALGADIRYAHPRARLSVMEIEYGLIPDMGISKTLPPLVGTDVARELTFTGRKVDAEEAARLGLVTAVRDEPLADAVDLAEAIAARNPHAIRRAKRLYEQVDALSTQEAFELETRLQRELLGSANQMEAVTASLTGRAPDFED